MRSPFERNPSDNVGQDKILVELTVAQAASIGRALVFASDVLAVLPDFGQGEVVGLVATRVQQDQWGDAAEAVAGAIVEHLENVKKLRAAQQQAQKASARARRRSPDTNQ